jgi:hypothetical protein
MTTHVTQTARYHFSVKRTEEGGIFIAFEAIEGDVFETEGIWMAMRSQRAADELASILNRSVLLVGRTLSTMDGVGGWSN